MRGPDSGRRQYFRRFQRRRTAGCVHNLGRRRSRGCALHQPGRRHIRGPFDRPRASTLKSTLSTSPAPITTTTATSTCCSCAAAGKSPPDCRCCATDGSGIFEDVTERRRVGRADLVRIGRLGRLRQRRLRRCLCLRRVREDIPRDDVRLSPTLATAAGFIITSETAHFADVAPRPEFSTSDSPREPFGATTMATACSISSFRTMGKKHGRLVPQRRERQVPRRRARSRTSSKSLRAHRPSRVSPACSGTSTTMAGSISSSTTGRRTKARSSRDTWGSRPGSRARRGSIATLAEAASGM